MIHVNVIAENKKFITTAELKNMGYSYYKIGQLEKAGLSYRDLHTIYVTHQHLDHLMGIVWLVRCIGMDVKNGKDFGSYTIYAHRKLSVVLDGICRSLLL